MAGVVVISDGGDTGASDAAGVRYCFQQSPEGALLAAANALVQAADPAVSTAWASVSSFTAPLSISQAALRAQQLTHANYSLALGRLIGGDDHLLVVVVQGQHAANVSQFDLCKSEIGLVYGRRARCRAVPPSRPNASSKNDSM